MAAALLGPSAAVLLAACAADPDSAAAPAPPDPAAVSVQPSPEPALDECSVENLTVVNPGQLTVGAAAPLDEPYFVEAKPGNGEGFESALVYAIAEGLGFRPTQVDWRIVGPGEALDPAELRVDFLVGRIPLDDDTDVRQYSVPYLQSVGPAPSIAPEGATDPGSAEADTADLDLLAADQPRPVTPFALAFPPGDPLVICTDGVLAELVADGEIQALADTWLPPSDASSLVAGIEPGIPATSDEASSGARVS